MNLSVVVFTGLLVGFFIPTFGTLITPFLQPLLMALTFFGTLDLKISDIITDIKKPQRMLPVLALIHLGGPFIIFLLRDFFSPEIFLGLIISTSVSSGISIIFLSKLFGGNVSQALVLTSISNITAPLTIPFIVLLFTQTRINTDPLQMSLTIVKLIVVPFLFAQIISQTKWKEKISKFSSELSILVLFFLIVGVIASVQDLIRLNIFLSLQLTVVLSAIAVGLFTCGYMLGTDPKLRVTFALAAIYRNFALSTVLSLSLFNSMIAIPSVVFTIVVHILIIPISFYLSKK